MCNNAAKTNTFNNSKLAIKKSGYFEEFKNNQVLCPIQLREKWYTKSIKGKILNF